MSLGAGALGSVRAFGLSAPSANDRFAIPRHLAETLAIAAAGGATLGLTGISRRLAIGLYPGSRRRIARRSPDADSNAADARDLRADWHFARRRGDAGDFARHGDLSAQHRGAASGNGLHLRRRRRISASRASLGQSRRISRRCSRRDVAGAGAGRRARRRFARDRDRADHTRRRHCGRSARRIVAARSRRPRRAENDWRTLHSPYSTNWQSWSPFQPWSHSLPIGFAFRADCSLAPCSPPPCCMAAA